VLVARAVLSDGVPMAFRGCRHFSLCACAAPRIWHGYCQDRDRAACARPFARRQAMSAALEQTIVDNEIYDLLKATASKLEGLAAYNKYDQDGQTNRELWRKLRQQDEQAVRQLLQQLTKLAQEGKLAAK